MQAMNLHAHRLLATPTTVKAAVQIVTDIAEARPHDATMLSASPRRGLAGQYP